MQLKLEQEIEKIERHQKASDRTMQQSFAQVRERIAGMARVEKILLVSHQKLRLNRPFWNEAEPRLKSSPINVDL